MDQLTRIDKRVYRASLYCRDDRWRIEHNDKGAVDITIVRKDKGIMWLLLARTREFKTVPIDPLAKLTCQHELGPEVARERIGTEILDGHPTTVSQVTVLEGGVKVVYYEWLADDLHLPLRVARKDGAWIIHYRNVKPRPLPSQMFELPLHYRPME